TISLKEREADYCLCYKHYRSG
ncbi:hypothetical protein TNCV_3784701, partial [Trichonephila clavipes]